MRRNSGSVSAAPVALDTPNTEETLRKAVNTPLRINMEIGPTSVPFGGIVIQQIRINNALTRLGSLNQSLAIIRVVHRRGTDAAQTNSFDDR